MNPFTAALAFTLSQEGGWADNPDDPGGATMQGVTLAVFREWLHDPAAAAAQLRAISGTEIEALYGALYWNPVTGSSLPAGVGLSVFDMAVNAGVRRSAMLLQHLLGVTADGSIGPETLLACRDAAAAPLVEQLAGAQLAFYKGCGDWPAFGDGWTRRVDARLAAARAALAGSAAPSEAAPDVAPKGAPDDATADQLDALYNPGS